ncbi:DUF3048 domain-containing protein [Candidatus Woesebacteria bacterium]|nr:DUF3048 domain-containing protein [Candidatus Woesebacteria bacterium]
MNKKIVLGIGLVLYLASSYGTYAILSTSKKTETPVETTQIVNGEVVDTAPKTEECPLNGKMYSEAARAKWEKRRPLGIMVQNNTEARPQSGISSADIVHEAVAEGGITRTLLTYYCDDPKIVGSVRSARIYFIRLLQGFGNNPLYGHVGGANTPGKADALGEIKKIGWYGYNDMDQFAVPFPNYWRDYDRLPGRATEHTMYTNTQKLWAYAAKTRKLSNVDEDGVAWDEDWEPWTFQDDAESAARGTVSTVSYGFWDDKLGSDYGVKWTYDTVTNEYKRFNGGESHIDKNTDKQLSSKNVIVAFADESVANDGYEHGQHLLYDVLGTDDAIVFQNGEAIKGTWKKKTAEDMMRFYTAKGEEIEMVRGQVWISILPTGNVVDY